MMGVAALMVVAGLVERRVAAAEAYLRG
jgi:hypothetical protein